MKTELYDPVSKELVATLYNSARTAGRDSHARALFATLSETEIVKSDPQYVNLANLFIFWLVSTDSIEFHDSTYNETVDGLRVFWNHANAVRTSRYRMPLEEIERLFEAFVEYVPIESLYAALLPAYRTAQVNYPSPLVYAPNASLTPEQQADPELKKSE